MTIEKFIIDRGIREVLHFTTNHGIVGTLARRFLLSRYRLPADKYLQHVLHLNSITRPEAAPDFDKSQEWLDFINLSISEINTRFLNVSKRWHTTSEVWWGILAFQPSIMAHDNVWFATTNNGYELCCRKQGINGLEDLFAPFIRRKSERNWNVSRNTREAYLPTCEQAEVLYPTELSTHYLHRIYVEEPDHQDITRGWLQEFDHTGVEVVLSKEKFSGRPN